MSIKKKYLDSKPECSVTFKLAKGNVNSANEVNLVGEFNNWDLQSTPMKKSKNGDFSVTVKLSNEQNYQFRYLIDKKEWINEPEADQFIPNGFQGDNSVVTI
jgi:1,4-alpha-glucan branching enzyme